MSTLIPPLQLEYPESVEHARYIFSVANEADFDYPPVSITVYHMWTLMFHDILYGDVLVHPLLGYKCVITYRSSLTTASSCGMIRECRHAMLAPMNTN